MRWNTNGLGTSPFGSVTAGSLVSPRGGGTTVLSRTWGHAGRRISAAARSFAVGPDTKDPYYGHEDTAKLCARFVTHLFACPDLPPLSTTVPPAPSPPLANFIAYALHRTRLHTSVTFAALYLLQRLKARFLTARSSSGHR